MPVNGWNETRADGPDLRVVRTGTVVRVSVRGEVDGTDGGELERALVAAVHDAASVEIDLAGVSFFGSYGVRALVAAWVAAQRAAVRLAVVDASRSVRRVLEIAGLTDRLGPAVPARADDDGPQR